VWLLDLAYPSTAKMADAEGVEPPIDVPKTIMKHWSCRNPDDQNMISYRGGSLPRTSAGGASVLPHFLHKLPAGALNKSCWISKNG